MWKGVFKTLLRRSWVVLGLVAGLEGHAEAGSVDVQRRACRLARHLDTLYALRRQDRAEMLALRETISLDEVRLRKRRDSSPSVLFERKIGESSPWGFRFQIRRQAGRHWNSNFGSDTSNPHFDPRAFIAATGPETAKLFGYGILSDDTMLVPSVRRFNSAIRAINRATSPGRGHLRISIRLERVRGKLGVREFLRGFARRGAIPVGDDWSLLIHDLDIHTLAVLMPEEFVQHARRQTGFVLDWLDHVKKSGLSKKTKEAIERHFFNVHTNALDGGGGVFGVKSAEGKLSSAYFFAKSVFVMDGASPRQVLLDGLEVFRKDPEGAKILQIFGEFEKLQGGSEAFARPMENMPDEAGFVQQVNARRRHFEALARTVRIP